MYTSINDTDDALCMYLDAPKQAVHEGMHRTDLELIWADLVAEILSSLSAVLP
jgi:hypothetical protein